MNIVITAGGTSERIDAVRKITNCASGKLGYTIAKTMLKESKLPIENLFYICTRQAKKPVDSRVKIVLVENASSVLKAVKDVLTQNKIDIFVHTMAVSDYTVDYITSSSMLADYINSNIQINQNIEELIAKNTNIYPQDDKISSSEKDLIIKLKPTVKIISQIKLFSPKTFLIGFKLLENAPQAELEKAAYGLMEKNKCSLVVANNLALITATKHPATILDTSGNKIPAKTKLDIAKKLTQILVSKKEGK